jgi:hypothetical protein
VGFSNLFSGEKFDVNQAIFTSGATNVMFAGYLMQTPPMTTQYPYRSGFLMSLEASETLSFQSQTCYNYIATGGYSTTITAVPYGRTKFYTINDSSNITFSKDKSS